LEYKYFYGLFKASLGGVSKREFKNRGARTRSPGYSNVLFHFPAAGPNGQGVEGFIAIVYF
jgi:hypothetical protein